MATTLGCILRGVSRTPERPLNILTVACHEAFDSSLAKTGHSFYCYRAPQVKDWNRTYRPLPDNITLLPPEKGENQLPTDVEFDLVVAPNIFGAYQLLFPIAARLHLPILRIEHTLVHPSWSPQRIEGLKNLMGHKNAFISHFSRNAWGFSEDEAVVVKHGIDTDTFKPSPRATTKSGKILTVVNDFFTPERQWCQPAGQKILTHRGWLAIEKIQPGMKVLAADGIFHRVREVFARDYVGDMIEVCLARDTTRMFTPYHQLFVKREGYTWKYMDANSLLPGDKLKFPAHRQTDYSFTDENHAWFIGLVVGDGSITKRGAISIVFNRSDEEGGRRASEILRLMVGNAIRSDRNHRSRGTQVYNIEATSKIYGGWLRSAIGGKASEKRLPDFIMNGSDSIRRAALAGLWWADGSFRNGEKPGRSPRAVFSNISPTLVAQVSSILHSYGVKCTITRQKRKTNKTGGHFRPIYRVTSYGKENVQKCREIIEGTTPLSSSMEYEVQDLNVHFEWAGKVYNCSVEDDPSYVVAPGFIAHNCCGYPFYEEATRGLPRHHVGSDPQGRSKPAASVAELVKFYREATVFVDTASASPLPTVLLEAMSTGCICVSRGNAMVPEVIEDGVNGFIRPEAEGMRKLLKDILASPEDYTHIAEAARRTILERFSLSRFVSEWDKVLRETAQIIPYRTGNYI